MIAPPPPPDLNRVKMEKKMKKEEKNCLMLTKSCPTDKGCGKNITKQNLSHPMYGPKECGIVASDIWRTAQVLSNANLNTWCTHGLFMLHCKYKSCHLCCMCMPQLILYHVPDSSISCLNVTYLFPVFPHSVSDLWCKNHNLGWYNCTKVYHTKLHQ
jgi:hypothetical protein